MVTDADGRVQRDPGEAPRARSHWIWGAFKMPGAVLHELHALWLRARAAATSISARWSTPSCDGGAACGVRAGESYVDVGTLNGYREAMRLLARQDGRRRTATPLPRRAPRAEAGGMSAVDARPWTPERIRERAQALGPWFHNLDLQGVQTAPDHFLGDYPRVKWRASRTRSRPI